mmetsp:Transcript_24261/g.53915  ORF Transcript_24261/g.53915 Transcript_24261/m.53915 type:complete len:114 (-) Transcript_24261:492-833(-)
MDIPFWHTSRKESDNASGLTQVNMTHMFCKVWMQPSLAQSDVHAVEVDLRPARRPSKLRVVNTASPARCNTSRLASKFEKRSRARRLSCITAPTLPRATFRNRWPMLLSCVVI